MEITHVEYFSIKRSYGRLTYTVKKEPETTGYAIVLMLYGRDFGEYRIQKIPLPKDVRIVHGSMYVLSKPELVVSYLIYVGDIVDHKIFNIGK